MASLPPASVPGSQFLEGLGGFGGFGTDPVSLAMMGLKSGLALSKGDFIGAIPVLGGPISMMMSIFGGGPGKTTASAKVGQQALEGFEPQAQIYEAFGIPMGSTEDPTAPRGKIWLNRGDLRRGNNIDKLVNDTIWESVKKALTPILGADKTATIFNELSSVSPLILLNNAEGVTQYLKERGTTMGFDLRPTATNYPESFKVAGKNVSPEEHEMLKKFFETDPKDSFNEYGHPIKAEKDFSALPEQLRGTAEYINKALPDNVFQDFVQHVPGKTTYTLWGGATGTVPPTPSGGPPTSDGRRLSHIQGSNVWSQVQESGVSPKNIGFVGNSDGTYDIVFNAQAGTPTGTQEISSSLSKFQQLASPAPVSQTPPPQASQEKTSFLTEGLYNAVKNLMGEASKQGLAPIFRGGIGGDLMGFAPIPTKEKGILGTRDFFSGLSQPQSAQQTGLQGVVDSYNKFQVEQLFPNESLKAAVSEETKKKIGIELPNLPISAMFSVGGGGLEIFKDILKGQKLPQERIQQIQEQAAQVDEQIGALQSVFTPRQPQAKLNLLPAFAFPFIPYEKFGFVPGMARSGGV